MLLEFLNKVSLHLKINSGLTSLLRIFSDDGADKKICWLHKSYDYQGRRKKTGTKGREAQLEGNWGLGWLQPPLSSLEFACFEKENCKKAPRETKNSLLLAP